MAIHEVVNIINFPSPLGPAVLNDIHEPPFRALMPGCIIVGLKEPLLCFYQLFNNNILAILQHSDLYACIIDDL